jgi:O-antigen ligase
MLLAFALCGLGLAQVFWSNERHAIYGRVSAGTMPFGPYVNRNNYAGIMEMLLPIAAAYILSRPLQPLLRVVLWSGVGIVLVSIWISGSRGGTLAVVLEGVVLAGILLWHQPARASGRFLFVVVGIIVFAAMVFSWMVNTGRVGNYAWTVFGTDQSIETKLGDRLGVTLDSLRMARDHPWIGVGVGCFEDVFPSYMTIKSDLRWTHAHDDFAEGFAETGLPGAVLILIGVVLFFRLAFRHLEARLRFGWGWIQMGAMVGVVGLLLHSFFDFNLRIPANAAWFVVCAAIATSRGRRGRREGLGTGRAATGAGYGGLEIVN